MENKYTKEIYDYLGTLDETYHKDVPFEKFEKSVQDEKYAKDIYGWISSVDNSFSNEVPFDKFSTSLKKKAGSKPTQPDLGDGGTASASAVPSTESEGGLFAPMGFATSEPKAVAKANEDIAQAKMTPKELQDISSRLQTTVFNHKFDKEALESISQNAGKQQPKVSTTGATRQTETERVEQERLKPLSKFNPLAIKGIEEDLIATINKDPKLKDKLRQVDIDEKEQYKIIESALVPKMINAERGMEILKERGVVGVLNDVSVINQKVAEKEKQLKSLALEIDDIEKNTKLLSTAEGQKKYKATIDQYNSTLGELKTEAESLNKYSQFQPQIDEFFGYVNQYQDAQNKLTEAKSMLPSIGLAEDAQKNYDDYQKRMSSSYNLFLGVAPNVAVKTLDIAGRAVNSLTNSFKDLFIFPAKYASDKGEALDPSLQGKYKLSDRFVDFMDKTIAEPFIKYQGVESKFINPNTGEMNFGVLPIMNSVADNFGFFAMLAITGRVTTPMLTRSMVKAAPTLAAAAKASERAMVYTTIIPAYMASYRQSSDEAEEMGLTGGAKSLYTDTRSFTEGLAEIILPNQKIFTKELKQKALKEFVTDYSKGARYATKNLFAKVGKHMGEEVLEEYFVMAAKHVTTSLYNLSGVNIDVYVPEVAEIVETTLVAGILSGAPTVITTLQENKQFRDLALYKMAQNFEDTKSILENIGSKNSEKILLDVQKRQFLLGKLPDGISDYKKAAILDILVQVDDINKQNEKEGVSEIIVKANEKRIGELEKEVYQILEDKDFDSNFTNSINEAAEEEVKIETEELEIADPKLKAEEADATVKGLVKQLESETTTTVSEPIQQTETTPQEQGVKETVSESITEDSGGGAEAADAVLDNLNPTGSVFSNYTPEQRDKLPLGKNITTYDKTSGAKPDELVTVYRGVPKDVNEIKSGDFVTTNKQLAKDYAGDGKVISKQVRADEILDDKTEPLGEEYILREKAQPISETETAENVALRDVESTAKALEDKKSSLDEKAKKLGYIGIKQFNAQNQLNENLTDAEKALLQEYSDFQQEIKNLKDENVIAKLSDDEFSSWSKANDITRDDLGKVVKDEEIELAAKRIRILNARGDSKKAESELKKLKESKKKDNWTIESWKERFDEDIEQSEIDDINSSNKEFNKSIDKAVESLLSKEQNKTETDAVQIEKPSQVPIQPEARISEEVEEGTPKAEPKEVAEEKIKPQEDEKNEQEPIIETIERKAESDNEVELNEAVNEADQLIQEGSGESANIRSKPIAELKTDEKNFQGRTAKYAKRSVLDILGNFNMAALDPIRFWKNEKGEDIVLAGHSRKKAFEIIDKLSKGEALTEEEQSLVKQAENLYGKNAKQIVADAKRQGFKEGFVPKAEEFKGTLAQAKDFALKSNAKGTAQTPFENSKVIAQMRKDGASNKEIENALNELAQRGDKEYTDNLSRLDPKGKAAATLEQADVNPDKVGEENLKKIREAANTTGKMRKMFPELTRLHEDEIFNAILDGKVKASEVADRVNRVVNSLTDPFNPSNKLNIEQISNVSPQEAEFNNKTNELKTEIRDLQASIKKNKDTGLTPIEQGLLEQAITKNNGNIEAGRKEFEGDFVQGLVKKKTDEAKALIDRRQKQLQDHLSSKKDLRGQGANLFDMPQPQQSPEEIAKKAEEDLKNAYKDFKDEKKKGGGSGVLMILNPKMILNPRKPSLTETEKKLLSALKVYLNAQFQLGKYSFNEFIDYLKAKGLEINKDIESAWLQFYMDAQKENNISPAPTIDEVASEGKEKMVKDGFSENQSEVESRITGSAGFINFGLPNFGFIPNGISKKLSMFFQEYFTSKGLFTSEIFERKIKMDSSLNSRIRQVRYTARDFRSAMGKIPNNKAVAKKVNDFLKGALPISGLPLEIQPIAQDMRNEIDALSREMIRKGIVDAELQAIVDGNLGLYLTRSYRVHEDPIAWKNYIENTPEGQLIRNRAVAFINNEYASQGITLTNDEINGIINEILHVPDAPMAILKSGKVGSKDLSTLIKRKDIAPEIRALLGEYEDPLLNYSKSVLKTANLIEKSLFLNDIKNMGIGVFLFEKPIGEHYVQIAGDGSQTMSPLNGLYTTPELAKAFSDFDANPNYGFLFKSYMAVNGYVKYAKTVLSVMTHIRNLLGNMGFAMMNGHYRIDKASVSAKTTLADNFSGRTMLTDNILDKLGIKDKKQWQERYKKYVELGVVYDNANAGEVYSIIKDVHDKDYDYEKFVDNRITKVKNKILKGVQSMYMAEDDVWKVYAFENEYARYRKAYPNLTEEQVSEMAAKIVRNTYPTYSLIPKAVKEFRKIPFFGTFVSFPAEVIRTSFNTVELAVSELKNPETRGIGAQRMAGIMTAAIGTGTLALISRMLLNMSADDEEDKRLFLSPWTKNGQLVWINDNTYVNVSYTDPHNYLKVPLRVLLQKGDIMDNTIESIGELFEPFLGEEILMKAVREAKSNMKEGGGQVYNPELSLGDRAAQISEHFSKALEPGTVSSFERIWQGVHGTKTESGRVYDPVEEVISTFTGHRVETLDVERALFFKSKQYADKISNSKYIYTKTLRQDLSEEERAEALSKANEALKRNLMDMHQYYSAAIRLGVDRRKILQGFKDNGISKENINIIVSGNYRDWRPKK